MKSKLSISGNLIAAMFAAFSLVLLSGCGQEEKKETKSMEQIRKEEGVPVKTITVEREKFEKYLSFFSRLKGIKESTKYSTTQDEIKRINYRVGDYVKEDSIVVEFPKDNPAIQYEQTKLAYENSKKTYGRMKALLDEGEVSQAKFDGVETQYLVNKRNYESMRQMLFVEAPISGTLIELNFNEGDDVPARKPMFTIAQLHRMIAEMWVSEEEALQLRKGMPAYIEWYGERFDGRITQISMQMDARKRAFKVEAEFHNPGKKLKSGITADVKIKAYDKEEAIAIPRNLIQKDGDSRYVFLAYGDKAVRTPVQTGLQSGLDVEITSGLETGDKVITKGLSLLEDGRKIKIIN